MNTSRTTTSGPLDSSTFESLTDQQQETLAEILENYLADLEAGEPVDQADLIAQHPSLADVIRAYCPNIKRLYEAGNVVTLSESVPEVETGPSANFQPTHLGDFVIKREIGRGGMGIVYAAEQRSLGRMVALKTLPFAALMNQQQVTRFKNEAQAAAGLHHPHIVPVFSVGCERGVHYFSMQLIEGRSLDQAILELKNEQGNNQAARAAPTGETTEPQHFSTARSVRSRPYARSVAALGKHVAEALHYAHENGVIHRDIKPSNLLLDADGKVWVTDFGLARIPGVANLTLSGDMLGTARYMSPEQASGRTHEIDHRTDVYSLGISLYELITLQPGFDGESRQAILAKVVSQRPKAPRELNPAIPVDLETIILKAIEPRREDRYHSAQQLAVDLQNFLDGRELRAKRPGLSERAVRWAASHRTAVTTVAAVLIMSQIFIGSAAWMLHVEKGRTHAEAKKAEGEFLKAQSYLRETQRVVDNFGALVDERLEHLPGTSELRAELLGELEQYYHAFQQEVGNDPSLKLDLAKTQFRLAAVHQRLGKFELANEGYQRALANFESILQTDEMNPDRIKDIALCHNNLGQVAGKLGNYNRAEAQYRLAVERFEHLARTNAVHSANSYGRTLMNLGLHLASQKGPESLETLQRAREVLGMAAANSPQDWNLQDQLALLENNLASVVMADDLTEAESLLKSSIERYETIGARHPSSPEHRSDHALAQSNLASILAHQGKKSESFTLFEKVVTTRRMLVELEPELTSHRLDLAVALQQLGQVATSLELAVPAKNAMQDADRLLCELWESQPRSASLLKDLSRNRSNLAVVQAMTSDFDEAIKSVNLAIDYHRSAMELEPSDISGNELLVYYEVQLAKLNQMQNPTQPSSVASAEEFSQKN